MKCRHVTMRCAIQRIPTRHWSFEEAGACEGEPLWRPQCRNASGQEKSAMNLQVWMRGFEI